jgi:ABC-type sulfate transport system substrate-binding protein
MELDVGKCLTDVGVLFDETDRVIAPTAKDCADAFAARFYSRAAFVVVVGMPVSFTAWFHCAANGAASTLLLEHGAP